MWRIGHASMNILVQYTGFLLYIYSCKRVYNRCLQFSCGTLICPLVCSRWVPCCYQHCLWDLFVRSWHCRFLYQFLLVLSFLCRWLLCYFFFCPNHFHICLSFIQNFLHVYNYSTKKDWQKTKKKKREVKV